MMGLRGMGRVTGNPIDDNGEEDAIRFLVKKSKQNKELVIFDVGANKGQYTEAILKNSNGKNLRLHLFEPSKTNCGILEEKLLPRQSEGLKIKINQIGLANVSGVFTLYTDKDGSDIASLQNLKLPLRPFNEALFEQVKVITVDQYISENNITTIDLLKIDVEGGEYNVIQGALNAINSMKVNHIQFEFGAGNITSRVFFHDFWTLLSEKYKFSQILHGGLVPVEKYSPDCEIFITTNYFLQLKK